jgi:hypothetical protein
MKATTTGNPKLKDIQDAYKLKHDVEERCAVCGAEISHMNKEMCKNSHMQKSSIPTNTCYGCPNVRVKLQAEREKVLDELKQRCDKRVSNTRISTTSLQTVRSILRDIEDLRQSKDGEL